MPGRGKAGGQGRGKGHGGGDPDGGDAGRGNPGRDDRGGAAPADEGRPDGPGRSEWSPGHLKKDAGEQSARDFAHGHGGEAPGRRGEDEGPRVGGGRDDQDEAGLLT